MAEVETPGRSKLFGFAVTAGLVAGLLLVGSIPVLAGVLVASIQPLGDLRETVSPASLGHLIWITPALYIVSSAIDAVVRTLFARHKRVQLTLGVLLTWLALLAVLNIFVAGTIANMIGSAVGTALYLAFSRFFERAGERVAKGDAA